MRTILRANYSQYTPLSIAATPKRHPHRGRNRRAKAIEAGERREPSSTSASLRAKNGEGFRLSCAEAVRTPQNNSIPSCAFKNNTSAKPSPRSRLNREEQQSNGQQIERRRRSSPVREFVRRHPFPSHVVHQGHRTLPAPPPAARLKVASDGEATRGRFRGQTLL